MATEKINPKASKNDHLTTPNKHQLIYRGGVYSPYLPKKQKRGLRGFLSFILEVFEEAS